MNELQRNLEKIWWVEDDPIFFCEVFGSFVQSVGRFETSVQVEMALASLQVSDYPKILILDMQIPYSIQGDPVPVDLLEGTAWRFGIYLLRKVLEKNMLLTESERIRVICYSASFEALDEAEAIGRALQCEVSCVYKLGLGSQDKLQRLLRDYTKQEK